MKKIKYLIMGFILFCIFGTINANALLMPKLVGNSVYRNATTATIRFLPNTSGTAYYKITSTSAVPSDIVNEENGFNVEANATASINLTDLSRGSKYVHIILKNSEDILSNVLTIAMPYDIYYYDDFESYTENTKVPVNQETVLISKPQLYIFENAVGTGRENQEIVNNNSNKVLKTIASSRGLDIRTDFSSSISDGYIIYQSNVKVPEKYSILQYGALTFGRIIPGKDDYTRYVLAGISNINETFGFYDVNTWKTGSKVASTNTVYNEKIILNVATKKYDYFVDDEKINTTPISAKDYGSSIGWFGIYNGGGTSYYDNIKMYITSSYPYNISKGEETNGTFSIDKSSASSGEIVKIINISPDTNYEVKGIKILKSSDNSDITSSVYYNLDDKSFIMPDYEVKVNVEFELITFTITVNSVTGATISPNGIMNVEYGDDQDITIISSIGYRLKSVKVNGVETLPLSNNKIILENITENKEVVVTVEKIEYEVTNGDGQKHIVGKNEDAVFRINADKDLFLKAYLNGEELDSAFYTITEGSTIITLTQDFLNTLLPNTYILKATFSDGGEATATFVIAQPPENNPQTGDVMMNSIFIGSISLMGLLGISIYLNKKKI